MKNLKKIFVLQHDRSDCGVACLASIIQYYGGEASLETLRKASGTSLQGTTLLGLMQAAQQQGMDAAGMEAEGVGNLRELKEPAILHVILEQKLQHYVVYYPDQSFDSRRSTHYVLGDPAKGIIEIEESSLDKIWESKALLILAPNEKFKQKKSTTKEKKKWIVDLVKEDFPLLMISLAVGICIAALGISTAIFSQKLIDDILPKENFQKLILSLVLVTLLLLARSGLNFLRGFFIIKQGLNFNNRMIKNFYGNVLRLPKLFFDTRKTGEIVARMSDTRRIQAVVVALAGTVIIDFLFVLVCFGFVFNYSSLIGVITIMCVPVYALVLVKFSAPVKAEQRNVMASYAIAESNFIDTIQGVAEIKLTGKEDFFEKQNASVYGRFQQNIADLGRLNLRFVLASDVIGVFFTMIMFGAAAWLVLDKQLKLGEMVALLGIIGNIFPSVNRLVVINVQIQEAKVAFDRMFEFTSMEKEQDPSATDNILITELKVTNLSFRFPGRKAILKDISFEIRRGEIMALLGESGEGKSTLIQLLQKFYSPESGRILVDGTDLRLVNTSTWRENVASVPQDVKIFNGNLLYNITLGDSAEEFQRAISFCEEKGFSKYFSEFPQGYWSLLGEEGINISGGEKQLVVLARALFRKPKLLLLDEPTSAMDRHTEKFVLSLLQKEKIDSAILIVTHRIKPAQQCDRIAVLEKGVIVTCGTLNELLKSDNFFRQLYQEI